MRKEIWQKEDYHPRIRYYDMNTNKVLVSLIIRATQINVYWNFGGSHEISQNLKEMLDKYSIYFNKKQHGVVGNWLLLIKNKAALQKLKEFIDEYKRGDWKV